MAILFAAIASVPFWSSTGHAIQAGLLACGAAFLAWFSLLMRRLCRAASAELSSGPGAEPS